MTAGKERAATDRRGRAGDSARLPWDRLTLVEVAAALDGETLLIGIRDRTEVERAGSTPGALHVSPGTLEIGK